MLWEENSMERGSQDFGFENSMERGSRDFGFEERVTWKEGVRILVLRRERRKRGRPCTAKRSTLGKTNVGLHLWFAMAIGWVS